MMHAIQINFMSFIDKGFQFCSIDRFSLVDEKNEFDIEFNWWLSMLLHNLRNNFQIKCKMCFVQ